MDLGVGADKWRLYLARFITPSEAFQPITMQTGPRDAVAVVPGCRYIHPPLGPRGEDQALGK